MNLLDETFIKLRQKNYAESTQKTYVHFIKDFLQYCKAHSFSYTDGVTPYIQRLISKKSAISTQNQAINAIKFFLEKIIGLEKMHITIDRPFKPERIPTVLSLDEIKRIIIHTTNFYSAFIARKL